MGIEIIKNMRNINKRDSLFNDFYLNKLVDVIIDDLSLVSFVRILFYVDNLKDFNSEISLAKIVYKDYEEQISIIINIF